MHFPMYEWGYGAHVLLPSGIVCTQLTLCMGKKQTKTKQRKVQGMLRGRSKRSVSGCCAEVKVPGHTGAGLSSCTVHVFIC